MRAHRRGASRSDISESEVPELEEDVVHGHRLAGSAHDGAAASGMGTHDVEVRCVLVCGS